MSEKLAGQVAIVTGAAHGMGEATAKTFAAEGATVCLLDIQSDAVEKVAIDIREAGGTATTGIADVRDATAIAMAVRSFEQEVGPADIVVNSAGLGIYKEFLELTEQDWDTTFDVNVKGTFLVCKAIVPGMVERGHGLVINVASLAALILGFNRGSCYSASKYAVRAFSSYLFRELRPKGIKVCCLCPGSTDSHFRGQPTGNPNFMVPQDVADTALYVATQRDRVNVAEVAFGMIGEGW